ncbi:PRC-barrel domain-containing protein [Streptomyces fumanus]
MMLFSRVRGLPVVAPDATETGVVTSLAVDVDAGTVTHLRLRGRHRRETVLPWAAVHAVEPDAVLVHAHSPGPSDAPAPPHDLLGSRVLTDTGEARGTVLDAVFDPDTGRVLAVFTTLGTLSAELLLGLGDYALVVRATG